MNTEDKMDAAWRELRAELLLARSERDYLRGKVEIYEAAIDATLADGTRMRLARADNKTLCQAEGTNRDE